eukprot:8306918-Karenia_brevis.AAC.1
MPMILSNVVGRRVDMHFCAVLDECDDDNADKDDDANREHRKVSRCVACAFPPLYAFALTASSSS